MDLWQLKIFCKVIELKSFSKAGEAVHLSQPTVSSHIKELEGHFDVKLVDRLARQALPTKAGELLYDYAHRLIALQAATEAAMAEFSGKIKGHLVIGGSTIPGGYLLPQVVGNFAKIYPGVHIRLVVADTSEIVALTLAGRIELGIVGASNGDKQLQQTPLTSDDLRLVVPKGHRWARRKKITLEALMKEPFIIREQGSGTLRSLHLLLQKEGQTITDLNIVAEMGSTEAVRQAIKNGVGVSILSAIAVTDDVQAGLLKTLTIEGVDLKRNFYLTTHKHRSFSPLCRAFIEFLTQAFAP
jgi:DNA-binding transcriptional LysR family regulator